MENQQPKSLPSSSAANAPKTTLDATTLEIAKLGYETAIQLWAAEIQNRMSNYNAMLVANSLILAAIGFSYQTTGFYPQLRFILSSLGIVLCAIWYLSEKRAIEKAIFWLYSATEIEGKYFSDIFATLIRSSLFRRGETVTFQLQGKTKPRRMKFWGRILRTQVAFSFIILLFVIMYVAVLALEMIFRR